MWLFQYPTQDCSEARTEEAWSDYAQGQREAGAEAQPELNSLATKTGICLRWLKKAFSKSSIRIEYVYNIAHSLYQQDPDNCFRENDRRDV